jgi:hypothetical protein
VSSGRLGPTFETEFEISGGILGVRLSKLAADPTRTLKGLLNLLVDEVGVGMP